MRKENEKDVTKAQTLKGVSSSDKFFSFRYAIKFTFLFFIFLILPLVSSLPNDADNRINFATPTTSVNYSQINVNNSQYLQGLTPQQVANLFSSVYLYNQTLVPQSPWLYQSGQNLIYNETHLFELLPVNYELFFYQVNATTPLPASYNTMNTSRSSRTTQSYTASELADGATIIARINPNTNLTFIQDGAIHGHTHVTKTSGLKDLQVYGEIYKRTTGGTETLIATTTTSSILATGVSNEIDLVANVPKTPLLVSDMLVWKLKARVTGSGNAPTIQVDVEGTTEAGVDISVLTSDITLTETDPKFTAQNLSIAHNNLENTFSTNSAGASTYQTFANIGNTANSRACIKISSSAAFSTRYSSICSKTDGSNNLNLEFYTGNGASIKKWMDIDPYGTINMSGAANVLLKSPLLVGERAGIPPTVYGTLEVSQPTGVPNITISSENTVLGTNEIIGKLLYRTSDTSGGASANKYLAGIYAVADGTLAGTDTATGLEFYTSDNIKNMTNKMNLTSNGNLKLVGGANITVGNLQGLNGNYTNGNCWTKYTGGIATDTNCSTA